MNRARQRAEMNKVTWIRSMKKYKRQIEPQRHGGHREIHSSPCGCGKSRILNILELNLSLCPLCLCGSNDFVFVFVSRS